jgi:nucleoside-diphosphate-sugar epimerase
LEAYRRVNVSGTEALLAEAADSGVRALVFTSSPSVVYHGGPLAGADESLPLTHSGLCPAAYPVSKAEAEKRVLAADGRKDLRTLALRPHLVWGPGDRHLIPRLLQRARSGRLRIVGDGRNRVDFVHIANCVDAHLLAAAHLESSRSPEGAGRAFFVTNGEPVLLWEFVKDVLARHGLPPVRRRIPLAVAHAVGLGCEMAWRLLGRTEEPPMTRFVASELAKDHWFSIDAARRILGYRPRVTMAEGLAGLPVDPDSDGRSSEPLEPASRRP